MKSKETSTTATVGKSRRARQVPKNSETPAYNGSDPFLKLIDYILAARKALKVKPKA